MAKSVKEIVEAAHAVVPRITPAQAKQMMAEADTLVIDGGYPLLRVRRAGGARREGAQGDGLRACLNLGGFKDWCQSGGPIEPAKPGGTISQPLNSKPDVSAS